MEEEKLQDTNFHPIYGDLEFLNAYFIWTDHGIFPINPKDWKYIYGCDKGEIANERPRSKDKDKDY